MIEADFQREYGLDLSDLPILGKMTWRRFLVLLRGIGPQSASVAVAWSRKGDPLHGTGRREGVRTITDPEEAERAFTAAFAPPRTRDTE